MDTVTKIREFIKNQAQVAADDELFTNEVDLLDYGYLDSFGTVALIELIDQEFGVDLSNADFYDAQFRTISGIAAAVDGKAS